MYDQKHFFDELNEQRLQYQLELQSHQIERVFDQHRLDAHIAGGRVQPQVISFDLQAQLTAGLERLRGLKGDLMTALGVTDVALVREDGKLQLRIGRPYEPPVALLPLLEACPDLSPGTIPIGLAEDGRPVLVQFSADEVTNVLVAGGSLAGKTTLLRTMAAALALCNRQSELQLVILDPCKEANGHAGGEAEALRGNARRNDLLLPLNYLPHLVTDVVSGLVESASVLQFLAGELAYRREQNLSLPRIIVLIDHAVTLLERGGPAVSDLILQLLQRGADAGIHLVLATRRAGAAELDTALTTHLALRLVGQVETTSEAYQASGVRGSQADGLMGLGDFVAILGDERTHFQAAYIGDYDLHLSLSKLYGTQRPRLLAQPFETRLRLPQQPKPENQPFSVNGGWVAIEEKQSPPLTEDDEDLIFGLD
jgi:DNA segregation ATPase FtsK/SpoIIIE-like protein